MKGGAIRSRCSSKQNKDYSTLRGIVKILFHVFAMNDIKNCAPLPDPEEGRFLFFEEIYDCVSDYDY